MVLGEFALAHRAGHTVSPRLAQQIMLCCCSGPQSLQDQVFMKPGAKSNS